MILVTGGTGLVGSHLIKALLKRGEKIKALYRTVIPVIEGGDAVEWIQGDILEVIALEKAMEGVDHVYHAAAVVSFSPKKKHEMFAINVDGTTNIVNACLNACVKKLCYVSSVAAIGKTYDGTPISETITWSEKTGTSNYSKTKYLAEIEVWRGIGEGLNAVIVNPSIILGAGNWSNGSSALFKKAYDEFRWYTEGVTGFVDVCDVIEAMVSLMESDVSGQRFIISAESRKYKDVFTSMAKAFGKKPPYKKVNKLMAGIVWRVETLKAVLANKDPLLTKETAHAAQAVVYFDNSKIKKFLPAFNYTSLDTTIIRICNELKQLNNLQ